MQSVSPSELCPDCPCPSTCNRSQTFCKWASSGNDVQRRHICAASVQQPCAQTRISLPPVRVQAQNLWRSVRGFVRSGMKLTPKEVRRARLAICQACPSYDLAQKRCRVCGCKNSAKVFVASDKCPLDPPRWLAIGPPVEPERTVDSGSSR